MSAVDGGDGSVLQGEEQLAGDSASVHRESDDQSQAPSVSKEQGDDGRDWERGASNSTSGRRDSSATWGEQSYRRGDRYWGRQWRDNSWFDNRSWWWTKDDQWSDSWDDEDSYDQDYCDDEEDDDNPSWDPWAEAWNRRQRSGGQWQNCGWRGRGQGNDRRREVRPPKADGGAGRVQGGDHPDHRGDPKNVWDGWRHYSGSEKSDSGSTGGGERRQAGGGNRPSEKLTVPGFSGEDTDDVGSSARSYLRQVEAWKRMTLLPVHQQGLVLYQHLSGKAWVAAEELNVDRLGAEDGVQYLVKWITNRYLDLEVTRIGKAFSEFFRRLRRRPGQSIRDYNSEYPELPILLK